MSDLYENARYIEIKEYQGINDEFHKAFKKIHAKQDVEDSSEVIQDFLDYSNDTKPSEYLSNRTLTDEEGDKIERAITLD